MIKGKQCAFIFLGYSFATATKSDYSRLNKQWNRSYIVERFGILLYQANDVLQTIKRHLQCARPQGPI